MLFACMPCARAWIWFCLPFFSILYNRYFSKSLKILWNIIFDSCLVFYHLDVCHILFHYIPKIIKKIPIIFCNKQRPNQHVKHKSLCSSLIVSLGHFPTRITGIKDVKIRAAHSSVPFSCNLHLILWFFVP